MTGLQILRNDGATVTSVEELVEAHGPTTGLALPGDYGRCAIQLWDTIATPVNLATVAPASTGLDKDAHVFAAVLDRLNRIAAVRYRIEHEGELLMEATPFDQHFISPLTCSTDPEPLHPWAQIAMPRTPPGCTIDSPLAAGRVTYAAPRIVSSLVSGETVHDDVIRLLRSCGLLGSEAGPKAWTRDELAVHRHSRWGLDRPVGGTYAGRDRGLRESAVERKPHTITETIPLEVPSPDESTRTFVDVVEQRRSIRTFASTPIPFGVLSRFLYYSLRFPDDSSTTVPAPPLAPRVVPGGGCLHEIRCYLWIDAVDGLEPGLYFYDGHEHALLHLNAPPYGVRSMQQAARRASATTTPPPIVISLTGDIERVAYKYESMAYPLMLKHVGVIVQQFYLVATALGLGPCALGAGPGHLFPDVTGIDPMAEPVLGEFMLGIPAEHASPSPAV